jgi:hypothetical protein
MTAIVQRTNPLRGRGVPGEMGLGVVGTILIPQQTIPFREEFRALLGVRKYPKNESSVLNWMLWGFRQRWSFGAGCRAECWPVWEQHFDAEHPLVRL